MPDAVFGPILVSNEEIQKELRRRSMSVELKTVKASRMGLVLEKVAIEEKDGWKKHKRNKKSYVVSKTKPLDEQLEDELWCIAAKMGFEELGSGRNFCIGTKRNLNPRQIDVFAKDKETALVIECTQREKPTTSTAARISNLIDKVSAFKGGISKSITAHYGRPALVKPKFIIATRNIEWGKADIEKCAKEGIGILTDMEINYYKELTKFLRSAARYQFLAHLFAGAEIPGLTKKVHAVKGSMGKVNYYNFLISPGDLIKIAYVGHLASRRADDIEETYQRMLQPNRLKSIANYITEGGKFPTNIVVNIKTVRKRKLKFENQSPDDQTPVGSLFLPNRYGSAWVIDGQHRLYGYAYLKANSMIDPHKSVLPVLAFENLPASDEMKMFIDINSKQVKVKTSLLTELYADLHWDSPEPAEQILALQARVVTQLNTKKTSPIFDRVVVTGKGKTVYRCLTATSLFDGLKQSRLLGIVKKDLFLPGPLSTQNVTDLSKSLTKAVSVLLNVLDMFARAMPDHWAAGDKAQIGYLCTNIGIRSIMLLTSDICRHVSQTKSSDLSLWSDREVLDEVTPYLEAVIDFFSTASPDQIQSFRRQGSSLASVRKQSMGMNAHVNMKFPEYCPDGYEDYITQRDQEGNDKALVMITRIQETLFAHVLQTLKSHFTRNEDEWWLEGIPSAVRLSCVDEREKRKRVAPEESYLYLINYSEIAKLNWDLFCPTFALGERDIGNKVKCTGWIRKLNDIRQKTHHPEKGKLNPDEIRYVEEIKRKVDKYFPSH